MACISSDEIGRTTLFSKHTNVTVCHHQPGRISRQLHLFFLATFFVDVIYCQAGKCTGPLIYFACVDWLAMTIILRDDDTHSVETGSSTTKPFSEGSTKYRYRCRNPAIMMMIITCWYLLERSRVGMVACVNKYPAWPSNPWLLFFISGS